MRVSPLMLAIALGLGLPANQLAEAATPGKANAAVAGHVRQTYIVVFDEAPVASFRGFSGKDAHRPALAATAIAVTGARKFDARSPAAVAYRDYLADLRRLRLNDASRQLGRQLEPSFVYEYALNGMAVALTPAEAKWLASQPGVKRVQPDFMRRPMTDRGPTWIKANQVWNGTATGTQRRGEGVIVGVIDTGINTAHVAFAATAPGDGYVHSNPKGAFLGNVTATRTNKLIGVYDFTIGDGNDYSDDEVNNGLDNYSLAPNDPNNVNGQYGPCREAAGEPNECSGHGTHTASTAAGNLRNFSLATTPVYSGQMAGVAPRANIISYKACEAVATCGGTWLLGAINQAISDGVDVINYSIGGDATDPWEYFGGAINDDAEAFLSARDAGIVVAASAGNSGPDPGTHGQPSNAPWVLGVAAATHDRAQFNRLVDLTGGASAPPSGGVLVGAGNTSGTSALGQRAIVEATDFPLCATGSDPDNNASGVSTPGTWQPGSRFANQIVVCQRGYYARLAKSRNVTTGCSDAAGTCGMVLVNQLSDADGTVADPHTLPATHLGYNDGQALLSWLRSGAGHAGRLEGTQIGGIAAWGDRLASFSGRGPVVPMGVLKPDVTAPGVAIYAAGVPGPASLTQLSGTSMAAPHVAGAAALLVSANPALTPSQIISALVLTARNSVTENGAPVTPHDQGAGTIDVAKAVRAGLYLDVTGAQFRAADPALGGDPASLNLPALASDSCAANCVLNRSFRLMPGIASGQYQVESTLPEGVTMTPSIGSFTLSGSNAQAISFTFDVASLAGQWVYGSVMLRNLSGDGRPDLVLPVAIYSDLGNITPLISRSVALERGNFEESFSGLVSLPNPRFVATDLVAPRLDAPSLGQDPTPTDPYDAFGTGVFRYTGTIPASPGTGAVDYRLRVTTDSASLVAHDVDLFVGLDTNGNGNPDASEELCASQSNDDTEECLLTLTTTGNAQTYWVLVQNYDNGNATDVVNIESSAVAMAAATQGTLVATGPGKTAANEGFSVRLGYDDPSFLNGQRRTGYLMLQPSPGNTGATIQVNLSRIAGGVAPFALANGVGRSTTLAAGAGNAHDKLYFDVPPHATAVTFTTTSASNVDLYVARVASPSSPQIDPAPARNLADASATTASGNETITLNGLQPGRWYVTPVNATAANATATVTATITAAGTKPAFLSGHYFNPDRSGHGAFIDFGGPQGNPDQWFMVWYSYLQDGTPTWYFAQGATPGSDGIWRTDLLRVVWNGDSASASDVGEVSVTATGAETLTFSYNIDGLSGSESMSRLGAGGGCPVFNAQDLDVSGHWYSPSKSGFGYSFQVTSGGSPQEIFIPYIYDDQGFPRWLYGQRGYDSGTTSFDLQWFRGFGPLNPAVALAGTAAGTGTRLLATDNITDMSVNSTMTGLITGTWVENRPVALLSSKKNCQ